MADNTVLLKRADAAVLSRDYALASRLYSTLLKETPDDKDLLTRLGNLYIKSGEDEKALPVFQKMQEKNPNDAELLLTLGGIYRRVKQYDESVKVLNDAIAAGAKRETAYYNLGFTYKFMGKYEDAIDCFETVVTLNTSDVLAYNHLGTIYELKGDHEAAITAYQKGLKVDSNHPILHLNLAKTYVASNNIDAALREYDAALRYKPGWDEAYIDYTRLLLKIGRLKDAENLAEQGIQLNSHNAQLQTILGDIYMAESDYESAEQRYNSSIQIEPEHTPTLKGLAQSLEAQGRNNEAIDTIQKARTLSPDDDKLIKTSASINLSAQKLAAASKDIKELFDRDNDDVETLDLAGQYYICTDDEERAKKVYKKIEVNDPEYKSHLSNASNRYKQKGDLQQAEKYITKYLDKKPDDAQGLVSLAQIEEKLGKTEQALANYTKALASDKTNRFAKESKARLADVVSEQQAAIQEQQEREAEAAEEENIINASINMGEEEGVPKEKVEEEDIDFNEDDFDFDTFGHSELIDDEAEKELDFHSLADDQEQAEEEQDTPMSQDLLEDQPEMEMPAPKMEAPAPEMEMPASTVEPQTPPPAPAPAPAPQFDANDLAEKMAKMAESAQKAMDAAQMAANARQEDEARRLAEENARLRAEQQEAARRAAEEAAKHLAEQQEAARKAAEETAKKLAEQQAALEEAAKKLEEEQEAARRAAEEEAAKKLAEEQAALEEAKRKLAEEQEAARKAAEEEEARRLAEQEEAAKKLAEEQEALEEERKKLQEEQEGVKKSAEANALEAAMKKMGNLIPAIENILKKDRKGQDFSNEIKLFKTLRALSESLPDADRKKFLQSRMRVTLDYLISALEGDPGLLKTSVALRKSGVLKDAVPEDAVETNYSIEELTRIVIGDMKALSENLEEKDLSIALNTLADAALGE